MNHQKLLLLAAFSLISNIMYAQSPIDSVVIYHCYFQQPDGNYTGMQIDSFDVNDQIVSSTRIDLNGMTRHRESHTYSSSGKTLNFTSMNYYMTDLDYIYSYSYSYDSNDSIVDCIYSSEYYSGGVITNTFGNRFTSSYLSGGLIRIDTVYSGPYAVIGAMTSKRVYQYDSNHHLLQFDYYYPNTGGVLTHENTNWYTYLPNDSLDHYYMKNYSGGSCDSSLIQYSYDGAGFLIHSTTDCWDSSTAGFSRPIYMTNIVYDVTHKLISRANREFIAGVSWDLLDSSWYTYDSMDRLSYQGGYSNPHGGSSKFITYDAVSGNIDSLNTCSWGTSTISCASCKLEYLLVNGVNDHSPINASFIISPNPASNSIQLILPESLKGRTTIRICDLQSKVMYSETLNINTAIITLNNLQLNEGLYFVTLTTNGSVITQKLVLN